MSTPDLQSFAPPFAADHWTKEDRWHISPFATNLNRSVYAPLILLPEVIGALCSRTSRAAQDLRYIFLHEFLYSHLTPQREAEDTDAAWREKQRYATTLREFITFLHEHSFLELFQNPRARAFYVKWLAQYGDDSIAQMAGSHLVLSGISQPAIKYLEDQRIGLAPIEKSTRYVDYSKKVRGRYLYYADPTLQQMGLMREYRAATDALFETYTVLLPKIQEWLRVRFPQEKSAVVRAKSFDVLRGLLPSSALSQVAFFGNGQSFEYMINRCAKHPLGELRWIAQRSYEELDRVTPSFLRRVTTEVAQEYQWYLGARNTRMAPLAHDSLGGALIPNPPEGATVKLLEYDPEGENKVLCGMLYESSGTHTSWGDIMERVRRMPQEEKRKVIATYLLGRTQRWQKVGRAFENAYVRFEISMNIGAYRDLHRHRMLTQQRQQFSCHHGYDMPQEVAEAGLDNEFRQAVERIEAVYAKIEQHDTDLAQYATTLAHRVRFQQWENLREFPFWEGELRTIPEGHPDYRHVEQEKFRLLREVYPLVCEFALINMNEYDFARRGQDDRIAQKEKFLKDSV